MEFKIQDNIAIFNDKVVRADRFAKVKIYAVIVYCF